MVPISGYYLGATPATPMNSAPFTRPQSFSQTSLPRSATVPAAHARAQSTPQGPSAPAERSTTPRLEPAPEAQDEEEEEGEEEEGDEDGEERAKSPKTPHVRQGTMDRAFKFPPPKPEDVPPVPALPTAAPVHAEHDTESQSAELSAPGTARGLSVEVPPPPAIAPDKERSPLPVSPDDDVGETEEISLA
jgi:hypothetical protein